MYPLVLSVLATCAHREAIDLSLRYESRMRPDPRLVDVQVLHCVLLFMFPLHVLLLVSNGVPPDVQETVGPDATVNEEGAEVKAAAVLGYDEIYRFSLAIAVG